MQNATRKLYEAYTQQVAMLNGISNVAQKFSVSPSIQQTLERVLTESSSFLKSINTHGVDEMEGEKIGIGVNSTIAGRTNTKVKDRMPREMASLDNDKYRCVFTEFDTALTYAQIDMWAKFPNFQKLLRDAIVNQQALDRIMIGFNGTRAATETNRATNPLLQDVNKGWLQQYRDHAPAAVMSEGEVANKITVGKKGDYENLDALVYDAVNSLIKPWYQERNDLVAVCGRKMLTDKYFPLINKENVPTETQALDMIISKKQLGGLPAVRVPFVPAGKLLITPLKNLSLYYQNGKRRRHIEENAKRSRVENYESSNDAYVVEDYDAGCLVENIENVVETPTP